MYLEVSKFSDTQVLWQEQTYLLVLISKLKVGVTGSSKGWCVGSPEWLPGSSPDPVYQHTPHHSLLITLICNCGEEIRPFRPGEVPVQYSNSGGPMCDCRELVHFEASSNFNSLTSDSSFRLCSCKGRKEILKCSVRGN